jgi:PT repeat
LQKSNPPYINEVHYANAGTDVGEAIEVAHLPSFTNFQIVRFGGSGQSTTSSAKPYITPTLYNTTLFPTDSSGLAYTVFYFPQDGLNNGPRDGFALIQGSTTFTTVIELLSYGGTFTAKNGDADGVSSTDIGELEADSSTPVGFSLQRIPGTTKWSIPNTNTFGHANTITTRALTKAPTKMPTKAPTKSPTKKPTKAPTKSPTKAPTKTPTKMPTKAPTKAPTKTPTKAPTKIPTKEPTKMPTKAPTKEPTKTPTKAPTKEPTKAPTKAPTKGTTKIPTKSPTKAPIQEPTKTPTKAPTKEPTNRIYDGE